MITTLAITHMLKVTTLANLKTYNYNTCNYGPFSMQIMWLVALIPLEGFSFKWRALSQLLQWHPLLPQRWFYVAPLGTPQPCGEVMSGQEPCFVTDHMWEPPIMRKAGTERTPEPLTTLWYHLKRNQAMQHTKAEGCAKRVKFKNFTCIVLHHIKNSNPQDPICN